MRMLRQELAPKLELILGITNWTLAVGLAVFTSARVTDPSKWAGTASAFLVWARDVGWWVLPVLAILSAFVQLTRARIGRALLWNHAQFLLDCLREEFFGVLKNDPEHFHRVTLYKHEWCVLAWKWKPGGGWMIPVVRSGSSNKRNVALFRASLQDPDGAEGVAGVCWAQNRRVERPNLPDITVEDVTEGQLRAYAQQSFISFKSVSKQKVKPTSRSISGVPISVKGKRWGCVVFDSRDNSLIDLGRLDRSPKCKILIKVLGSLLDKG
jgi:hypothetical protein